LYARTGLREMPERLLFLEKSARGRSLPAEEKGRVS
jgi:hypothetical protein